MERVGRRGELVSWVYGELRARILDGQLEAGSVVRERELCAELDVSRVPIREALPRLEAAGLVLLQPRRPAVVTAVTRSGVDELYDIRAVLEPLAAAKAGDAVRAGADPHALIEVVDRAGAALERHDMEGFHRASGEVHAAVEGLAGGALYPAVMDPLRERSNRLNVANMAAHPAERHREHLQLVEAIVHGRPEVARAIAFTHVEFGRMRVLETLHSVPGYDPEG